jgi:hypothetical protein
MATVKLATGQIIENVRLTDVKHVGEEGSRTAIAHIEGRTYEVYNSIVDGFNNVWCEQMDYETWKALGSPQQIVEGSVESEE